MVRGGFARSRQQHFKLGMKKNLSSRQFGKTLLLSMTSVIDPLDLAGSRMKVSPQRCQHKTNIPLSVLIEIWC